jgi:ribosomal protein L18E
MAFMKKIAALLKSLITLKIVHAEEMENNMPPADGIRNESTINYEELISKARKEEKDKLYPKIKSLEDKIKEQTESINKYLLSIGAKDKEIESLRLQVNSKADSEQVKQLKDQIASLEKELAENKSKAPDEEAIHKNIREELEAEYEVKMYRIEQLNEAGDSILTPELVIGATKEDIDKSIDAQKAKTLEIKKKLGVVDKDGKPVKRPYHPSNPSKSAGQKTVDFEYLASLDPASEEYKEARKKLGLK